MKSLKIITASGVALALLAGAAQAQPAPGERPPAERRAERPDPAAFKAKRAEHLSTVLQLTPAQKPALDAYLAALAPPEGAREGRRDDAAKPRDLTTPQRLDAQAARLAQHQQAFAKRAEATKRFYAQLTPSQQKAFDALRPQGPRGARGPGGHEGHREPGGPGGPGPAGEGAPAHGGR